MNHDASQKLQIKRWIFLPVHKEEIQNMLTIKTWLIDEPIIDSMGSQVLEADNPYSTGEWEDTDRHAILFGIACTCLSVTFAV